MLKSTSPRIPFAVMMAFIILCVVLSFSGIPAWASDKKGVGLADIKGAKRIAALNVAWYYTWKLTPIEGVSAEKFVPMIHGRNGLQRDMKELQARGKVATLLVINEPNKVDQANLSVDAVVRLWPEIEKLADNISTPSVAGITSPWFDRFYRIAKNKNLKMDFMAVHIYGPPNAEKILHKIDAAYKKYRMPIWITEFAVADWDASPKKCKSNCKNRYSEDEVLAFMKEVLPELEKRPYITHYAWFGAGKNHPFTHEQVRTSRLFEKNGDLTPLGKFYADFQ